MTPTQPQVALFVDLENLISTIKHRSQKGIGDFGTQDSIDFEALVSYIEKHFGSVEPRNFFVAANFAHYNQQLGGLNRLATLINMDSFDAREVRSQQQRSPGKRHVISNYSDMALAFQAGAHIHTTPADVYIFVTGDGAFAAVGELIRERYQRLAHFILPEEDAAAAILRERFFCIPFADTQPTPQPEVPLARSEQPSPTPEATLENPTAIIQDAVGRLRAEFSTAIPVALLNGLLGPGTARPKLERARTEEVIDIWSGDGNAKFISLHTERMFGKIHPIATRPGFVQAARVLEVAARIGEGTQKPISRAEWRKALKQALGFSNSEGKKWLELLLSTGILRDEHIQQPRITLNSVIPFLHQAEALFPPQGSPNVP